MQWYGFALIGGGWATAYFVTYAMYHVAAVKVLFDPNLGLLSLVLATSLMMVDMLRYRSQAITVVVYLLGFITAGIGSLSTYSLIYAALLTMSMLMVINRMKWNRLMLIALPASYVTHLYWLGPEITHAEFYLSAGFLSLYGLLYSLSPMLVRSESEEDRKIQTTVTLINTTAYAWLMFRELDQFAGIWKFYFCLGLGLLHALAALLAKHGAKRSHLVTAHVTLALSFITLSFPLKYSDRWVEMAWLSEIPLLIFLGMYFKRLVYRVFAWGLGFVMSLHIVHSYSIIEPAARVLAFQWSDRMIVAAVAVVAFILAQTIYLWRRKDDALIEGEPAVGRGFLTVSVLFIGFLTMIDIHPYQMSIAWAVCAAMYFVPGFVLRDRWMRYAALALVFAVVGRIICHDMVLLPMLNRIFLFVGLGLSLLAASFLYGRFAGAFIKKEGASL